MIALLLLTTGQKGICTVAGRIMTFYFGGCIRSGKGVHCNLWVWWPKKILSFFDVFYFPKINCFVFLNHDKKWDLYCCGANKDILFCPLYQFRTDLSSEFMGLGT